MLDHVRIDLLHNPSLILEVVAFQTGIFLLDLATLWCTSRAVGMNLDLGSIFISFVLASVVATLSPIPLGLGSFEGSCTALLHLMGGGLEASLAGTLMLRGLTLWLPMLPGLWMIRHEAMLARRYALSGIPVGSGRS
jgi:glycosyltransferase 2 family protein